MISRVSPVESILAITEILTPFKMPQNLTFKDRFQEFWNGRSQSNRAVVRGIATISLFWNRTTQSMFSCKEKHFRSITSSEIMSRDTWTLSCTLSQHLEGHHLGHEPFWLKFFISFEQFWKRWRSETGFLRSDQTDGVRVEVLTVELPKKCRPEIAFSFGWSGKLVFRVIQKGWGMRIEKKVHEIIICQEPKWIFRYGGRRLTKVSFYETVFGLTNSNSGSVS